MRWEAIFFLQGDEQKETNTRKETHGFKTKITPGQCKELSDFENVLLKIIKTVEFRKTNDPFQTKLRTDINKIKNSKNVFIFAAKQTTYTK